MAKEVQVTVRVDAELVERADALAEKLGGIAKRTSLLRQAMQEGFGLLEERYRDIASSAPQKSARKRRS